MSSRLVVLLALQIVAPLAKVVFGVLALRVARQVRRVAGADDLPWLLTGGCFLVLGASNVLHGVAAATAVVAGAGSPFYEAYLRWSAVGMQSRTAMMIAFAAVLALLPYAGARLRRAPRVRIAAVALAIGMAAGGVLGWREGSLSTGDGWETKAALDVVELVAMLALLGLALATDALDRYLWGSLAIYSFQQGWNVVWYSAIAWWDRADGWAPDARLLQLYMLAAFLAMAALAVRRLSLARRGAPVRAPLEWAEEARRPSFFG